MKNSNKTVNITIIIGIIFLIGSLFLMLSKKKEVGNHIVEITYNEYQELIKKDEYTIILLSSPTCSHCKNYKPSVNSVSDEYDLKVYDINVSSLSYEEYVDIHDMYSATKNQYNEGVPSLLTPTTIITKNGEEVDSISGDLGYTGFINLLELNGIIKK